MHRRVFLFLLLVLGLSSRANAALVVFDMCTEASLCGQVEYNNVLQPGGDITGSITNETTHGIRILQFGVNVAPGVETYFFHGPLLPPYTALGAGSIGGFGDFTDRWAPPPENEYNLLIGFHDPAGPLPDDLAPFFENLQGVFIAAQVFDNRTGVSGFVAGRLVDSMPVPEPGTLLLLGTGLVVAARRARQRRP